MSEKTKQTQAPRNAQFRLREPLKLERDLGIGEGSMFSQELFVEERHGPFRFSPQGVAFGPEADPVFVPWSAISGVSGWEPPAGKG